MSLTAETEAGTFHGCVMVLDTARSTPRTRATKSLLPGVGLVRDADAELVEYG
jgi:hypothetical protein